MNTPAHPQQKKLAGAEAACKDVQTVGEDRQLLKNGRSTPSPPSIPTVSRENPAPSTKLSDPGTRSRSPAKVAGIICWVKWVTTDPPPPFIPSTEQQVGLLAKQPRRS